MNGLIKGLPISHFADYSDGKRIGPRIDDQGEIDACLECEYLKCPINSNPVPEKRRCNLERYLYAQTREVA